MAQPNYIEIGTVCQAFQETTPAVITSVYFTTSGGSLLKNVRTDATSYYPKIDQKLGGPIVKYADYKFKVWYDASLTRGGPNQQNWRRLSDDSSGATMPSDTFSVMKAESTWPAATASVNGFTVTYGSAPDTYTMNKATDATFENAIAELVQYPIGIRDSSIGFYLREKSTSSRYLSYSANPPPNQNPFKSFDTGSATFTQSSITQFFFIIHTDTGTGKELGLSTASTNTSKITGTQVQSDYTVLIDGVTYELTTTQPAQQLALPGAGALPTTITMIKSVTGKYMFWDGSYPGNFTLKDYWNDSLTIADIKRGIQFYFVDLTAQNASGQTGGGSVDFYTWNVINNSGQPVSTGNTANVTIASDTLKIQATQTAIPTTPAEGWTFNATGNTGPPYHLLYVKETAAGSGDLKPVAYANIVSGGNTVNIVLTPNGFNDLTSPNAIASKSWYCIKCSASSIGTDGICQVSPAPSAA